MRGREISWLSMTGHALRSPASHPAIGALLRLSRLLRSESIPLSHVSSQRPVVAKPEVSELICAGRCRSSGKHSVNPCLVVGARNAALSCEPAAQDTKMRILFGITEADIGQCSEVDRGARDSERTLTEPEDREPKPIGDTARFGTLRSVHTHT
jgi:hypothetical protein